MLEGVGRLAGPRRGDRRAVRPPGLAYWTADRPPPLTAMGLALQHLALQSVAFVVPAALAASLTGDPALVTRFVALSLLAAALWQGLQLLPRGPVGSGYAIPACSLPAAAAIPAASGGAGADFETLAAVVLLAGLACLGLGLALRRPRLVLPNEVAGVIVLLLGVGLVALGLEQLGPVPGGAAPSGAEAAVLVATLLAIAAIALSRTRAAPLAVLLGAVLGTALALALGLAPEGAAAALAAQPWFALPVPWLPRFDGLDAHALPGLAVAVVAAMATVLGSLVLVQRAAEAGWTRPDEPPIRRGLLANGLGIMAAGLMGGALPGPATAALGLSVGTGTLARRIVWIGAGLLAALALCPKLVALLVLVPGPVKAALLVYVAGVLLGQGCQLVAARLLDTRRMLVVTFGLGAGLAAAIAPAPLLAGLPALASPLALGAAVALATHLLTLPLVGRRAERALAVDAGTGRALAEWFAATGGAWGLKPTTVRAAENALTELLDLLAARKVPEVVLRAALVEDRVEVTLAWSGPPLPPPATRPRAEDVLGDDTTREAFAVWLAARQARSYEQRDAPGAAWHGKEAILVFED